MSTYQHTANCSHIYTKFSILDWYGLVGFSQPLLIFFCEDELSCKLRRDFQRMTPTMTHDLFKSWDLNCSFWPKKEQPWWDPYPSPAPLLTSQMSLGPKNLVMALSYFAMIILNLLQSFIAGPYTHWIWSHGFCTHQKPAVTICGSSSCCWISPAAIWPLARLEFVCCKP